MRAATPRMVHEQGHGAIFLWLGIAAAVASAALLYFFNPVEQGFFPQCVFHSVTGLDCPGCGGLRAVHQLLHGHFLRAFQFNPLFICLLPLAGWWFLRWVMQKYFGRAWPHPFQNTKWPGLLGGVIVAFGVLRNLPWHRWFGA